MTEFSSANERQASEMSGVSASSPVPRRPGWRWIAAGLVALIVLGGAVAYSLWWTNPKAFTVVGNGFGFKQTTKTLHPVTVDMVQRSIHDGAETVTVNRVSPRVVRNTAGARITFAVCGGPRFMSADGPASSACETATGVVGKHVLLTGGSSATITMTVIPQHAGLVVINGMEVDYTRGEGHLWQHGSQATGPSVRMHIRE